MNELRSVRSASGALFLLLAANFLLRAFIAVRPIEAIDRLTIPDDAYLSLHLARNIAHGLGPLYGAACTNGFQPLYVFLCAPAFWMFPTDATMPVHFALLLLSVFDTLALYFLFRILRREGFRAESMYVAGVVWLVSPYVIRTTLNGLETMIASCLMLAFFWYERSHVARTSDRVPLRRWCVLGLLAGASIVARIDSAFLVMILMIAVVVHMRRSGDFSGIAPMLGCALLALVPWLLYSYRSTGSFYYVSGTAVRFLAQSYAPPEPTLLNWYFPALGRAIITIAHENWHTGVLIALLAILLIIGRKPAARLLLDRAGLIAPMAFFVLVLAVVYPLYAPAAWFYPRYLFPSFLFAVLLVAILSDILFTTMADSRRRFYTALGLGICAVLLSVTDRDSTSLFTSEPQPLKGYRAIGLWVRDSLPSGSIVGAPQSGAIGYFATNMTVLNLDGVVNRECLDSLMANNVAAYIESRKIESIIGWQGNFRFLSVHSRQADRSRFVIDRTIPGVESWGMRWCIGRVVR